MDISCSVTSQGFIAGKAEQGLGIYPQEASYLSKPLPTHHIPEVK